MKLDNERPSDNIEDRRGQGGGFGFPRGGRGGGFQIPMGGGGRGFSLQTIILLVAVYLIAKFVFGVDLIQVITGGGGLQPPGQQQSETQLPSPGGQSTTQNNQTQPGQQTGQQQTTDVTGDAGKDFVARVLGSTERVWTQKFQAMGRQYQKPTLVLFSGFVQSACGMAQSAMGPFYCPGDNKVYIDLSFYQDMKNKLGAPGDFAQAYVIAHEVGHHIQNQLGIAAKVTQARMQVSKEEGNLLSVRMELQADCLAGVWARSADDSKNILEQGDVEEGLNAAAAIGDDRLQRRSQGYVVPESFTHGSSEQRVRWFKRGMETADMNSCDTFGTDQL
ncbi:KPN_02809 family neutral zinc metallopeptidase [Taklimakanibacter lacteus]|uniref:KPN_02809 family neutral zinc metallopeptidase n=1 Tax=Taklimakanibacter lacteus TaxID=2268456 RepID=UPI000E6750C8